MLPKKFAFVDTETTGATVTFDRIIEIGILLVDDGKVVETFESLLNPQTYISPFIEELTGIKKADLENAPTFNELKHTLFNLLSDRVFVAHNARFDYGFLKNEFRRHDISFSEKTLCTVKLSRMLYPEHKHHNLDAVSERFNLSIKRRHRAFDDAKAICDFFSIVAKQNDEEKFGKTISILLKKPSVPLHLLPEDLEALPSSPGVYIFYGENGTPLYVGKSINIKERVLSHFSSDYTRSLEMQLASEAYSIKTITTAGELGALLLENQLIKSLQPLYNRKLRYMRKLIAAIRKTTEQGYDSVVLQTVNALEADKLEAICGIFKSVKQAKEFLSELVKKHNLCEKLLGLDTTNGRACFAHHLGWCKGACQNKENSIFYNARFLLAFSKSKIRKWPFEGKVAIVEERMDTDRKEVFILDKWCVLQSFDYHATTEPLQKTYEFDLDTYKILTQFFRKKENLKKIHSRVDEQLFGSFKANFS